jgi:hypothetical protein
VKDVVTGTRIILGRTVEKGRMPLEEQFYSGMSVYDQAIAIDRAVPEFSDQATKANPPRSRVLKW